MLEILIFALILTIAVVIFLVYQKLNKLSDQRGSEEGLKILSQNLEQVTRRFDEVTKNLGEVSEIGRDMKNFQKDFFTFFHSAKLRGNIGEYVLRNLLEEVLPKENFSLQYRFKQGNIVDAIIETDKGLIPIDSKFPVENFRNREKAETEEDRDFYNKNFLKDVKKHILAISEKYILPSEGTVDFAIMYVPSEAVYYDLVTKSEEISSFAWKNRVLITSPNSFYYFLRIILMGLEGKQIEEQAEKIMMTLKAIEQDSEQLNKSLSVLDRHITNAKNAMDNVDRSYRKLDSKIDSTKLLEL